MCGNAPNHHAVTYGDFVRIRPGVYRLADPDPAQHKPAAKELPQAEGDTGQACGITPRVWRDIMADQVATLTEALKHLPLDLELLRSPDVFPQFLDASGQPFETWEDFCRAPCPYGLETDPVWLEALCEISRRFLGEGGDPIPQADSGEPEPPRNT